MWEHRLSYEKIRDGRRHLGVRFWWGDRGYGSIGKGTFGKIGVTKEAKIMETSACKAKEGII